MRLRNYWDANPRVWKKPQRDCDLRVSCKVDVARISSGFEIAAATLEELALRGIRLGVSIYVDAGEPDFQKSVREFTELIRNLGSGLDEC